MSEWIWFNMTGIRVSSINWIRLRGFTIEIGCHQFSFNQTFDNVDQATQNYQRLLRQIGIR